jgi:hypothetical protein
MPSTPYAKLLISVNGGALTSGAITANPSDTIQFSAESTAQWDLTTPPRWEIYAYPPGWTGPATGWTTESVPQPGGGSADVYVYLGIGPPAAFTLPALPMWGKFLPKLTVAGGLLNGVPAAQLVDKSSGLQTIGPNGLLDVAVGEEGQFDSARAWVGPLQDDLRLLDAALAGSASPYASLPTAVTIGTGAIGGVNQYAQGDHEHSVTVGAPTTIAIGDVAAAGGGTALAGAGHVHALPIPTVVMNVSATASSLGLSTRPARDDHEHELTFATLNTILAGASAPITVNGQTFTSGGFIGPYFASSSPSVAASGLVRAIAIQEIIKARDDGDGVDINLVTWGVESTDIAAFGSTANAGTSFQAGAGSWGIRFDIGGVNVANWNDDVLGFFVTSPSAGGGDKLLVLGSAATSPTSAAAGTIALWSRNSSFRALAPTNVLTILSTSLDAGTGVGEDLRAPDRQTTRTTTTDATVTTIFTFPLAEKSVVDFTATVQAYSADGPNAARIKVTGGAYRALGGAAALLGSNDTSAKTTAGAAAWALAVTTSGNNLVVVIQGDAGRIVNWFSQLEVNYMGLA